MAQSKPHLSITLPRSFHFHYNDAVPQTPAPQAWNEEEAQTTGPPPPPRQTFKVKRRRPEINNSTGTGTGGARSSLGPHPDPLPSIEMTDLEDQQHNTPMHYNRAVTPGYLAPVPQFLRLKSPPRTPAAQVTTYGGQNDDPNEWSMMSSARIERPMSACSSFSDSSAASFQSSNDSRCSFDNGSCTSPESDAADPFAFYEVKTGPPLRTTTLQSSDLPMAKRPKTARHVRWTPEMDEHLWITYMFYVQDPRLTPFKMLPGTAPPLGVCHRVARESKRTWRGHRSVPGDRLIPRISVQRAESPDSVCPANNDVAAPANPERERARLSKWPRSEAATRKRLRELCKRKPSLSAHYQRLLRNRSPSPFESSNSNSPKSSASAFEASSAFSSRALNTSLTAATAPSMQANGPLARLQGVTPKPTPAPAPTPTPAYAITPAHAPAPAPAVQRPTDWFARIGRSQARAQAHQKSQSLQLGLGLNTWSGPGSSTFERGNIALASPFDSEGHGDVFTCAGNATQSLGRAYFGRKPENASTLNSPFESDAPLPTARSLKRRFGVEESAPTGSSRPLEDLFHGPARTPNRPIRQRGFSLGDVQAPAPNIASFFAQPTPPDHPMGDAHGGVGNHDGFLGPPKLHEPPRLGSPFGGQSSNRPFNTFPRCFPNQDHEAPQSFEERLRHLSATTRPG